MVFTAKAYFFKYTILLFVYMQNPKHLSDWASRAEKYILMQVYIFI
jgi:hypothetical protein